MAPVPASGTGCQSRCPQPAQNSFGGMASSPQQPHRIPVSRPARASSKKLFRLITRSVTAEQTHDDRRGVAAERMGQAGAGAVHLASVRLTAKLRDDLGDLGGPGGADRVALGL